MINLNNKMERKEFLKKIFFSLGSFLSVSALLNACENLTQKTTTGNTLNQTTSGSCTISPSETKGPFPIKTPSDLAKANIVSDRKGIPLLVTIKIQNKNNNCKDLSNVMVDIWHCDAEGNYSEYGGTGMQSIDYTSVHFLRGRQTTNEKGEVSFITIYPGWYRGRAPHIHVEILDNNNKSLLSTQIAFPEDISDTVYTNSNYKGKADTSNSSDNVFSNSISLHMADSIKGNNNDCYTLSKIITVNG